MSLAFSVRGQKGSIPAIGLGTATLFREKCAAAVRAAIQAGYRHIDTALLYDNQEAVGAGIAAAIAAGEVTREELFVTSKVAFYPAAADGTNCDVHIAFVPENRKGHAETLAAVDLCLAKLQLSYVDLMLIHNPCTNLDEYQASTCAHNFELARARFTPAERALIMGGRLAKAHERFDLAAGEAARGASWRALEDAQAAGKCKFIGVSNYSPFLLRGMEAYARVQPAVNQLELHPWASSPALRAHAAASGMALTAYGTGNSVWINAKCAAVAAVAAARGLTPHAVVQQWTLARGVGIIPRTANAAYMAANLQAAAEPKLTAADLAQLDALNAALFYYWVCSPRPGSGVQKLFASSRAPLPPSTHPQSQDPMPLQPPGAKPDC